jgi:hypothetical protein
MENVLLSFFYYNLNKYVFSALPILASLDLCLAAMASESAYSVVPELFPQRDRIMGTALIGIVQVIN